jgi:hypothetical protein
MGRNKAKKEAFGASRISEEITHFSHRPLYNSSHPKRPSSASQLNRMRNTKP